MVVELHTVVDKLIGQYAAYGEHHGDMEAYENLNAVGDILIHLTENLCDNVLKMRNNSAYSIEKVGKKSEEILIYVKGMIEDFEIGRKND